MAIISSSVGFLGKNGHSDVMVIQTLLNAVPAAKGGALPALQEDGKAGPKTNLAILSFQKAQKKAATGRIDPGDSSESALVAEVIAAGLASLLPGGQPSQPGQTPPAVPPAPAQPPAQPSNGSDVTPFRTQFRHIIENELKIPKTGTTNGHAPPGASKKDSGCGELPSRVWKRIDPQRFVAPFICGKRNGQVMTLIDYGPTWHFKAEAMDATYPIKCWVPFSPGKMPTPRPGDIFVEVFTEKYGRFDEGGFAHVGMIWSANGPNWRTVESGLTNVFNPALGAWSTGYRDRVLHGNGHLDDPNSKRRVAGFVNVDVVYARVAAHAGGQASPLSLMGAPQQRVAAPLRSLLFAGR